MATLAGALTGLGLLALPAVPSPAYYATVAATDTWSRSITDSGAVVAFDLPINKAGSDTWSLSLTEAASSIETYTRELTYPRLALPGKYTVLTDKASPGTADVNGTDTWFLSWTETPTNLLEIDTWDTWAVSWSESVTLSITQTYAATDTWGLQFLDVGSVFVGGPVLVTPTDSWSLALADSASANVSVAGSDTWSLSITDSASKAVTQDAIAASDTWSLSFTFETAFYNVLVEIPKLASDQWSITFAVDAAAISQVDQTGSPARTIFLAPQRRTILV